MIQLCHDQSADRVKRLQWMSHITAAQCCHWSIHSPHSRHSSLIKFLKICKITTTLSRQKSHRLRSCDGNTSTTSATANLKQFSLIHIFIFISDMTKQMSAFSVIENSTPNVFLMLPTCNVFQNFGGCYKEKISLTTLGSIPWSSYMWQICFR